MSTSSQYSRKDQLPAAGCQLPVTSAAYAADDFSGRCSSRLLATAVHAHGGEWAMFVTYNEDAIMSIAETELKAIQAIEESAGRTWYELGLRVGRVTPALSQLVQERGGFGVRWGELADGTLCTVPEGVDAVLAA